MDNVVIIGFPFSGMSGFRASLFIPPSPPQSPHPPFQGGDRRSMHTISTGRRFVVLRAVSDDSIVAKRTCIAFNLDLVLFRSGNGIAGANTERRQVLRNEIRLCLLCNSFGLEDHDNRLRAHHRAGDKIITH